MKKIFLKLLLNIIVLFFVLFTIIHNLEANIVGKNEIELKILGQNFIFLDK